MASEGGGEGRGEWRWTDCLTDWLTSKRIVRMDGIYLSIRTGEMMGMQLNRIEQSQELAAASNK